MNQNRKAQPVQSDSEVTKKSAETVHVLYLLLKVYHHMAMELHSESTKTIVNGT